MKPVRRFLMTTDDDDDDTNGVDDLELRHGMVPWK